MNRLKLLGYALIASSFYFLWVYALALVVVAYNVATRQGFGLDFAGDGVQNFLSNLVGIVPLAVGVYLVKKSR